MSRLGILIAVAAVAIALLLVLRFNPTTPAKKMEPDLKSQPVQTAGLSELGLHTWHEYSAPNHFKVLFPSLPQHASEAKTDPKTKETRQYEMYVSEKDNGSIFMITMITFAEPPQKESEEKLLTNLMNEMLVESPENRLKNMKVGNFRDHTSLNFAIEKDQVNIDGRGFFAGNTLYMLSSIAKMDNYKPQEFEFFVNSFELLPATAKPQDLNPVK